MDCVGRAPSEEHAAWVATCVLEAHLQMLHYLTHSSSEKVVLWMLPDLMMGQVLMKMVSWNYKIWLVYLTY